jgi:hypothetical protein
MQLGICLSVLLYENEVGEAVYELSSSKCCVLGTDLRDLTLKVAPEIFLLFSMMGVRRCSLLFLVYYELKASFLLALVYVFASL